MSHRSPITTHVLDTALGKPAAGVPISLAYEQPNGFVELAAGVTNDDGRIADLLPAGHVLAPGRYRMRFELSAYARTTGQGCFYPYAEVVFELAGPGEHYHIPLLWSPYGYSTYRGS